MMWMVRSLRILAVLISVVVLAGCAGTSSHMIPQKGLTMSQIYYHQHGESQRSSNDVDNVTAARARVAHNVRHTVYSARVAQTATQANEVDSLFKPLPNPQIAIYVYPHLAQMGNSAVPVPGYTTQFFLYQQNHYAMSDENY